MVKHELFEFNEIYEPVFTTKARYIDIWGGRAGGRSHFGTDYFLYLITSPEYFRGCFLRNVYGDIRDSLFRDFKDRLERSCFDEEEFEINESKMTIVYRPTGNSIISKGFTKSSGNRSAKLKSLAGLTHVLIEEADENSETEVNKLDDSIRTDKIDNIQIIFLHNPPNKNHWLIKRFYNLVQCKDEKGDDIPYYKAIKKTNPDVLSIHSTYKNNIENLNKKTVARYEAYGDPQSQFYDPDHYYVNVQGLVPEGAKGRIYKGFKPINYKFFRSLPYQSYYGLDFGYSDHPAALVEIKSHNNRNFWHEVIYESGLTNPQLAAAMRNRGVDRKAPIYADSAEMKSIQELRDLGFNVKAVEDKSVKWGINQVKSHENYYTENSTNVEHELQEYRWDLDQDGNPTDQPVKKNDDALDAGRYAITTHKQLKRKKKVSVSTGAEVRRSIVQPTKKDLLDLL